MVTGLYEFDGELFQDGLVSVCLSVCPYSDPALLTNTAIIQDMPSKIFFFQLPVKLSRRIYEKHVSS